MRHLLLTLLSIHAIIHLIGFSKAFHLSNIQAISKPFSKTAGLFWLLAALLLLAAAMSYFFQKAYWWLPAISGALLSQVLIFGVWQDGRFGTIANVLVLLAALPACTDSLFARKFKTDERVQFQRIGGHRSEIITAADLEPLPLPVQAYLRYTGCVGKCKVRQMRVRFDGMMREKGKNFFSFKSEQVNNFDDPARLFFMRARIGGLPTTGYHRFVGGQASMDIRLLSILPVAQLQGREMDQAETVTFFNDMCLLAPATLIDPRIRWQSISNQRVKAWFTIGTVTISAILVFNEKGQLVNFISDDRYARIGKKLERLRFSTPVQEYKEFGSYRLPSRAEAVYEYPDGPFAYGRFVLTGVWYNEAARADTSGI